MDITVFDIITIASWSTMNADAQCNKSENRVFLVFKSISYIVQFNVIAPRNFRRIHDLIRDIYRVSGVVYTIKATLFFTDRAILFDDT